MLLLLFILSILNNCVNGQYEVPDALVEALSPKGIRVSIPDEEGIKLFAFHGKINEQMNGRESGVLSRDIIKSNNGRWIFLDKTVKLKPGDVIYYWTYVDYFDGKNKLGYAKDDQKYIVQELVSDEDVPTSTSSTLKPCEPTITTVNGDSTCSEKLLFHEKFISFNNKWQKEIRFAGEPDYEFVIYAKNSKNIYIENEQLHIKPVLAEDIYGQNFTKRREDFDLGAKCTGIRGSRDCVQRAQAWNILPPVASSKLHTKNKFSFRYGKIEIKAKLPEGDWIYPELYLNSKNEEYGPNYESGQIRVAFLPGNKNKSNTLSAGIILGSSIAARNYGIKTYNKQQSWSDGFHKFVTEWRDGSITVSVDGHVYGVITPPNGGFVNEEHNLGLTAAEKWRQGSLLAPFDKEMYIAIGVGVGGHNFPDENDGSKPWVNNDPKLQLNFYKAKDYWIPTWTEKSALIVEYIKVWAI